MNRVFILMSVLLSVSLTVAAQDEMTPEQLERMELRLSDKSLGDREKMTLYDELSWGYQNSDFERSIDYARKGLVYARHFGETEIEGYFYLGMGTAFHLNLQLDSAAYYYGESLRLAKRVDSNELEVMINNSFGNLYNDLSQYDKAMTYYQANLRLAEIADDETVECYSLAGIGAMYMNLADDDKALEYLNKANALADKLDYKNAKAGILTNLDEIYCRRNDASTGLDYSIQAVRLYDELGYYPEEINALLNVARNYYLYQQNYPEALNYATEALELAERVGYAREIGLTHAMFAMIYHRMGRSADAKREVERSLEYYPSGSDDLFATAIEIEIDSGNRADALRRFEEYRQYLKNSWVSELSESLSEMEVRYQTEKKDLLIESLNRKHRLYVVFLVVVFMLALSLGLTLLFSVRYHRQKRLRIESQLAKLEQEKKLIAAQALLEGENYERVRLSQELHDGLGGMLTMAKLSLEQVKARISDVENALSLTDKSITELRRVSHNLMPQALLRFGLKAVLSEFCSSSSNIEFHFYGEADRRYASHVEANVYRIVCELLNNALKHSGAAHIDVQLITERDKISVTVQDNGKGFDVNDKHYGLNSVLQRVDMLGARVNFYSRPGAGTEVTLELDIKE